MQKNPYNTYRKSLAWIGFAVVYLALPILLAATSYWLFTT